MVSEFTLGLAEVAMKGSGETASRTVRESVLGLKELATKGNG